MSSQFDHYAKNYNQVVDSALAATGEGKDYFANARVRWVAEQVKQLGINSTVLLDYGCGNGEDAELMETLKLHSLVGVDVSEKSIEEARRTAPTRSQSSPRCQIVFPTKKRMWRTAAECFTTLSLNSAQLLWTMCSGR